MNASNMAIYAISALTTLAVLARPLALPEAFWAVTGAALIVVFGLLPLAAAVSAVAKGADVYLFLTGMMLLSETARREGLFDWIAAHAVNRAAGSRERLFFLLYGVGVVVTIFLSNDATAVVLTPAVFAAARKARAEALPYLLICAFTANAASFVLPISNPANLVLYRDHVPPLGRWLASFALPSLLSIITTCAVLRFVVRADLEQPCERVPVVDPLTAGARTALFGLLATSVVLMLVSAMGRPLGLPTCVLGAVTAGMVLLRDRSSPWALVKGVSWSVLPLVGGLFVLVEALDAAGMMSALAGMLQTAVQGGASMAAAVAGAVVAVGSNVVNNLPAGLVVSTAIFQAKPPRVVADALLIGIDLGPNLSITGSLATLLWLSALRREGENVSFLRFLKAGAVVMPSALLMAIGVRLLIR